MVTRRASAAGCDRLRTSSKAKFSTNDDRRASLPASAVRFSGTSSNRQLAGLVGRRGDGDACAPAAGEHHLFDVVALDAEIDGFEPIRPPCRQSHIAAREPGLRLAFEADEDAAAGATHAGVAVADDEYRRARPRRYARRCACPPRSAAPGIGETELAIARGIGGARLLEAEIDAAGDEIAHRVGLDRKAAIRRHEAARRGDRSRACRRPGARSRR